MTKKRSLMLISGTLIGAFITSILVYFFQGEFPVEVLAGATIAAILLITYQIIKHSRKKHRIPEVDERVSGNMFRFLAICSHIGVLALALFISGYTAVGHETIPLFPLWIILFIYLGTVGIGIWIVKRR